jgi:UDP-glucose 4-epimerase
MKVLLTGATGLVGTEVLSGLADHGHRVTALSRNARAPEEGVEWISCNLADINDLQKVLEGLGNFDVLIHNAGSVKSGAGFNDYNEVISVNVLATSMLFSWASSHVSHQVLFTGSFSVLQKPLPALITEESTVACDRVYPMSKLMGEQMLLGVEGNFKKIIMRISSPVSDTLDRMPDTVLRKWIKAARNEGEVKVFGEGARMQDFVATADISSAICAAIGSKAATGVYNIASGKPVSMKDTAEMIARRFGASVNFSGTDALDSERWNIDISKAAREFGYAPRYASAEAVNNLLVHLT